MKDTSAQQAHSIDKPKAASTVGTDLAASLVVFLVALPLSLGIALASGAPLMSGLIAAVIGGIVVGIIGGAPLQVSGPAAGLAVILYGYVQQFGWGVTCAITVAAGVLQLVLGAAGVAPLALGISPAVIHGMLAAIGVLIALAQAHVVLGSEPHGKGLKNLFTLPESIAALDAGALTLGLLTIGLLVLWQYLPKHVKRVPAALVAVAAATVVSLVFRMEIPRVELGGSLLHSLHLPTLPGGDLMGAYVVAVLTLCFVASAESLLCAVATDKLHDGPRANLNRELMGQGVANTLSGLVGGLPITGVIVRSSTNIDAGAKTNLSAILHGVWVLLFVVALPGVITQVPLAALAGLLVFTGIKLVNVKHIKELQRHGELPVYAATLVGIIATSLLTGLFIGFGLALARLLWKLTHVDIHVNHHGTHWLVTIDGSLTFAGVPKLTNALQKIPAGQEVEVDLNVRFMDHAGLEALDSWRTGYERAGGSVTVDQLHEVWTRSVSKHPHRNPAVAKGAE